MTPLPFLNFIHKPKNELEKGGRTAALVQEDASEPEKTCPNCHKSIPLSRLWSNWNTCACGYHFRMGGRQRLRFLADKGSFQELFSQVEGRDPLSFPGYREKLEMVRDASSEKEAVLCGTARIGGAPCCLFIMEPYFMMGSMGTAVGEKITSLFEYATEHSLPVVGYTVSGGARMQEGLLSLMQMAKTSGAVKRHSDARSVLLHGAHRPHHRRGNGQLCHGGRHHPGRARRHGGLCRGPGGGADHPESVA